MSLASVMYELSIGCPSCKQPLPINGATESVLCARCHTTVETPPELFRTALGEPTATAIGYAEGEGRNSTILGQWRVQLTYGRLKARCEPDCKEPFPEDALRERLAAGGGELFCGACGKGATVRPPPPWFREATHPLVIGVFGETAGAERVEAADPKSIRFHCYHCGAAFPLSKDMERSPTCAYCDNAMVVPDEIWLRLHPVATVQRWWALLDVAGGVGVLPSDCSDFADFTITAEGELIVAWEADDDGEVGHPARVARVGDAGLLRWIQDGVEFSEDAELQVAKRSGLVVLVDKGEWSDDPDFVRLLDPKDGAPVRTLDGVRVKDLRGFALDWDDTLLVHRTWEEDGDERAFRRFSLDTGERLPLWSGASKAPREGRAPSWGKLGDFPVSPPGSSDLFGFGWDGVFYLVAEDGTRLARYGRDGRLMAEQALVVPGLHDDLEAFAVTRDGTIYLLGERAPSDALKGERWAHVWKLAPGASEAALFLGPLAPGEPLIDQYEDALEAHPDGRVYLGRELEGLRVFGPDGAVLWKSTATKQHEQSWLLEHVAKLRRGKKLAEDRE